MSCEIQNTTGPKVIHDHQTCIACRPDDHKCGIEPLLTPGLFYDKCTLLVRPEGAKEPLTPLADLDAECDRIVAVTKCDVDLTEVTEGTNYPCGVLTNIGLDPNYICWPETATAEQIDRLVRNMKGCIWFVNRFHCTPVPPEMQHLLETKKVAEQKAGVLPAATRPAPTGDAETA